MPILSVENLSAQYGDAPIVDGVSFDVDCGEIVALLGANGAGKTTTLLAISGILGRRKGHVRLLDCETIGMRPHEIARMGMIQVPEGRGIFMGLTVRENLWLAGNRGEVRKAFDFFPELSPLLDRRSGLLSGGEQQMLALARAFMMHPKVLLIDEMSLGLAPLMVARLVPALREIAHQGAAVVLVEQHIHVALEVADRAHVMRLGKLVLSGASRELSLREEQLALLISARDNQHGFAQVDACDRRP